MPDLNKHLPLISIKIPISNISCTLELLNGLVLHCNLPEIGKSLLPAYRLSFSVIIIKKTKKNNFCLVESHTDSKSHRKWLHGLGNPCKLGPQTVPLSSFGPPFFTRPSYTCRPLSTIYIYPLPFCSTFSLIFAHQSKRKITSN